MKNLQQLDVPDKVGILVGVALTVFVMIVAGFGDGINPFAMLIFAMLIAAVVGLIGTGVGLYIARQLRKILPRRQ